jgi:hypothetical protein
MSPELAKALSAIDEIEHRDEEEAGQHDDDSMAEDEDGDEDEGGAEPMDVSPRVNHDSD